MAEVWLRSFGTALPRVRRTETDEQVRSWFREVIVPDQETWVATADGSVVGMMDDGDLNQLPRSGMAWPGHL
ncbi:hypothetical protein GCM10010272_66050 [Streptomyces lateritius]|nr:hypothetical protein GCM10010272_66050 [Streptomyces lateritius]